MRFLLERVDCELPAPVVAKEAGEILQDIVRDNQVRGVSDDEMRKHQDELIGAAQQGARDRVRGNFLLLRVAEKEKLEVTEEDLTRRVLELAARYEIPVGEARQRSSSVARDLAPCASRSSSARPLICSPRMLGCAHLPASQPQHESYEEFVFSSDRCRADKPRRACFRHLFPTAEGSHCFYWHAD